VVESTARAKCVGIVRRVLPSPMYSGARAIWLGLRSLGIAAQFGLPEVIIRFGYGLGIHGLGDDLLCTAVLRELRRRRQGELWMISNHPELFGSTGDADRVFPIDRVYDFFSKMWGREFRTMVVLSPPNAFSLSKHVIAEMCAVAGITGYVTLRPYLALDDSEAAEGAWASGCIVVQSSGLGARHPVLNKEWYPERFKAVVDALRGQYEFIQIGSASDPPLAHARDLRGKSSIRESAAILHHARLYIGLEGFLMHLARAVDCPSVIVYGGRTSPSQTGYICNKNLYSDLSCAPCGRWDTCDFGRKCMAEIQPEDVVVAVHDLLRKPRNPLMEETAYIR
jgi:hypothetical protein